MSGLVHRLCPHRLNGPDLIPVRSDLAERELSLLLINRDRDHLSALQVHRIVREDRQPVPPPQRTRVQLKRHLEHVGKSGRSRWVRE